VPEKEIAEVAAGAEMILAVEMNIGKYAGEIERVAGGRCPVVRVTKNRGLVHTTSEIRQALEEAFKGTGT
jgi:2-oxoglutarate ferredoxin oxidoreductase subunit alpha